MKARKHGELFKSLKEYPKLQNHKVARTEKKMTSFYLQSLSLILKINNTFSTELLEFFNIEIHFCFFGCTTLVVY